jgi:tetratricopeptide (TPR) repeat protein
LFFVSDIGVTDVNKLLIQALDLQNQGETAQAAQLFRKILESEPANAAALYSLSLIMMNAGELDQAKQYSSHGVQVQAGFAPLWFVHGAILQALGDKQGALDSYDQALQVKPDYLEVLTNSGVLLRNMMRHKESLERFQRVLAIDPNHQTALTNSGILLTEFKQSEQAIAMFDRLLKINPDYDYGPGLLAYERLHICDWTDFAIASQKIVAGIRAGKRTCKTLALMAISDSASDHFQAAQLFGSNYCPPNPKKIWQGERYRHDKIRLAYISPDFR